MTVILTIIAFLVIFSLLVLVHEIGHFAAARWAGIKVEEFGIGLPPKIKQLWKDKKGTIYSLNLVPVGGFVKMLGEDATDKKVLNNPKSFAKKSIGRRAIVIVAGVAMNFLLAWFLLTAGFSFGMEPFILNADDLKQGIEEGVIETLDGVMVYEVIKNGPADKAGLKAGDVILSIDGEKIRSAEEITLKQKNHGPHYYEILRDSKEMELSVLPDSQGKIEVVLSSEPIIKQVNKVKMPLYKAAVVAFLEVGRLSILTVEMLGKVVVNLISKLTVPEGVAGPIGIAQLTHQFVQLGIIALIRFTALLSVSLGVVNIMPFPALDGGRLLFIGYELIFRRKADAKVEAAMHGIGFALLMILIAAVTWKDIMRLFG